MIFIKKLGEETKKQGIDNYFKVEEIGDCP
jgi:hypothetical protein